MLAESPAPVSRLDSLFCDAADTPSAPNQYRPRRLRLLGRKPLQEVYDSCTNSNIQASMSASNTPGICTLMQKAEKLSLNSARPPSRDPLAKAARACEALLACCSPSPQPAAHNPKRKLYDSPAGDLTSRGPTPSSGLGGRRSRSMPQKRRCAAHPPASTLPFGEENSPAATLRSCISAPEAVLAAANASAEGPLSTPVGRSAALSATCMEHFMGCSGDAGPSLWDADQAARNAAAGWAATSAAMECSREDSMCSPAPSVMPRTPAPPAKRRSGCLPLPPPPTSLLPQIENASIGLPSIEPSTLAALITGKHDWGIEQAFVIDCRYDYEHSGGCVSGAVNMQDPTAVEVATVQAEASVNWSSTAVVFYCEFSSERAPRMFRHIRNLDRRLHLTSYPHLAVPHMYVMAGGYKAFQEEYPQLCTPHGGYVRMHDKRYGQQLKEQHAASKTAWCTKDARKKTALPRHN